MITVIEPTKSYFTIRWREILEYRDLLFLLARRNVTVVYKQTILGPAWFFIQPIITSIVFTVIFGRVAKIGTGGIPHFVFYMSGLAMWNYFNAVLSSSASSLVGNAGLLSKVYFPRLIIPFSAVLSNFAHFLLNLAIFVVFYLYFFLTGASFSPSWWLLALPLVILYTALVGLGFGLWVAALTTKYRDLRMALPFVLQMWLYATPVIYPASGVVQPLFQAVLWANPMSIAVELNRYLFTGVGGVGLVPILIGLAVTTVVLVSGLFVFNRVQRNFVDTV